MSVSETQLANDAKETGRIEAFSDGVFAIAITLLILDVRPPADISKPAALVSELVKLWPAYLAYVISFTTIGIMWIQHHKLLTLITRSNHALLLLNTYLMFWVTFVPFPTSLLADYISREEGVAAVGAIVYSGTYFMIAVAFNLLWRYAAHNNRLLDTKANPRSVRAIYRSYAFGPLLYLVALALAFVSAQASVAMNMLLALFFALPDPSRRSLYDSRGDQGSGVRDHGSESALEP
jgi:uncharacterized membrane protein